MRSASNSATIASTLNNNRPGQPVEFGDDQGVALPAGGQCFPQTWSVVVAAGQRNEHHR
jgi:hypothetical protein